MKLIENRNLGRPSNCIRSLSPITGGKGGGQTAPPVVFFALDGKPLKLGFRNLVTFPNHSLGTSCQNFEFLACAEAYPGIFNDKVLCLVFYIKGPNRSPPHPPVKGMLISKIRNRPFQKRIRNYQFPSMRCKNFPETKAR